MDDILVTRSNSQLLKKFKEQMKQEFEISDLGLMNYFLGIEVYQMKKGIFLT